VSQAVRNWYEEEQEWARMKEKDQTVVFSDAEIEEAVLEEPRSIPENVEEIMVDDIARQEEMEMEALLASLPDHENREPVLQSHQPQHEQLPSTAFFENDDDYDEIFMELIQNESSQLTLSQDAMDMC
jgi:hypothetical protein